MSQCLALVKVLRARILFSLGKEAPSMLPVRLLKARFNLPFFKLHRQKLSYRLHLEELEKRLTPATVTNTNASGPGPLADAIGSGDGFVNFDIPGPGVHTIALSQGFT